MIKLIGLDPTGSELRGRLCLGAGSGVLGGRGFFVRDEPSCGCATLSLPLTAARSASSAAQPTAYSSSRSLWAMIIGAAAAAPAVRLRPPATPASCGYQPALHLWAMAEPEQGATAHSEE